MHQLEVDNDIDKVGDLDVDFKDIDDDDDNDLKFDYSQVDPYNPSSLKQSRRIDNSRLRDEGRRPTMEEEGTKLLKQAEAVKRDDLLRGVKQKDELERQVREQQVFIAAGKSEIDELKQHL